MAPQLINQRFTALLLSGIGRPLHHLVSARVFTCQTRLFWASMQSPSMGGDYTTWSHEALIARVHELEESLTQYSGAQK